MACTSNGTNPVNCTSSASMASIELYCDDNGLRAAFNHSELKANILPYTIMFMKNGNESCDSINATDALNHADEQVWIWANYSDCGIEAYVEGENIAFEQTIIVEYGSKSSHDLIYRYFNDTYKVQCLLNRNVTKDLSINVKERKTLSTKVNQTANFEFDFNVYRKGEATAVNNILSIGEELSFVLEMVDTTTSTVKASPQDCFATRLDGSGRYDLIKDRCEGDDDTVSITTPNTDLQVFKWDMTAFRYFGDSDGVKITCSVLVCRNIDPSQLSEKCLRCGQTARKRRRREADGLSVQEVGVVDEQMVTSQPIYIIDRRSGNSQPSSDESKSFFTTSGGTVLIALVGVLVLTVCAVLVKKNFFNAGANQKSKDVEEVGVENPTYGGESK